MEVFLQNWDRHVWMAYFGSWASEDYAEAQDAYADALTRLREVSKETIASPDRAPDIDALREAMEAVEEAVEDLRDCPYGESDYVKEGTIDPDGLEGEAEDLDIGARWEGWDCSEGWDCHRVGDDLVLNWWRAARGNRHERDLWLTVEADYFAE